MVSLGDHWDRPRGGRSPWETIGTGTGGAGPGERGGGRIRRGAPGRGEGEKKSWKGNLQHVDFPPGHPRQYSGHSQLLDFQVLMDLGIFNWMWS